MPALKNKFSIIGWNFLFISLLNCSALGEDVPFTNFLAHAALAEKCGDMKRAMAIYAAAQHAEIGNAANLCVLARRYCDLGYLKNSKAVQKDLIGRARACSQQAVTDDPRNATAHSCLAVCYAKSCSFVDIKTELDDSSRFKIEAEKAIALDPKQDVAYYLLGRWNYGIASAGVFSRAYVKIVYGGLPKASYTDAIFDFKKAVELAPNLILNHAGLAMAYATVGEKKLEIAELEKCCALPPLDPEDTEARRDAEKKLAVLLE